MKATLTNYTQTPRKVRLVTDLVKGKTVTDALNILAYTKRGAADEIAKLISSAAANAAQTGSDKENLRIENITVDKGMTIKRFRPRWRGMASPLRRERSHVTVSLKEIAAAPVAPETK